MEEKQEQLNEAAPSANPQETAPTGAPVSNPTGSQVPSPAEARSKFSEFQQSEWKSAADKQRLQLAKNRGLLPAEPGPNADAAEKETFTKQVQAVIADIKLEGDTICYATDKDGRARMATDSNGFMAMPKTKGRRKPHMTKHAQGLKSAALRIFGGLFRHRITVLEAEAQKAGETFNGVPQAELTKLAAKASVKAAIKVKLDRKERRRRMRNESKLQRRINRGVVAGNVNRRAYTIN